MFHTVLILFRTVIMRLEVVTVATDTMVGCSSWRTQGIAFNAFFARNELNIRDGVSVRTYVLVFCHRNY